MDLSLAGVTAGAGRCDLATYPTFPPRRGCGMTAP